MAKTLAHGIDHLLDLKNLDEEALQKLEDVGPKVAGSVVQFFSNPDNLDKLVQFAHGKGFVCRPEDMSTAIAQYKPRLESGNLEPLKQLLSGNN